MITSDPTALTLALLAGLIAGTIFFAGLWYTLQRLAVAKHPALLVTVSFVVRVIIVLGAFFLVGRGHPDRMLISLLGFVLARFIVMRITRGRSPGGPDTGKEAASGSQS